MEIEIRQCCTCGQRKPVTEYSPRRDRRRYYSRCKPCQATYMRNWRAENKAQADAVRREYVTANRKMITARDRHARKVVRVERQAAAANIVIQEAFSALRESA